MVIHSNCNASNLLIHDHHLIRGFRILTAEELTFEEIMTFSFLKPLINPLSIFISRKYAKGTILTGTKLKAYHV